MARIYNNMDYSYLQLTELDEEFRRNPHARLDRLRSSCPAYRLPDTNRIFVTSYKEVRAALESKEHSRDWQNAAPSDPARLAFEAIDAHLDGEFGREPPMAFRDDPDHARVRKVFASALSGQLAKARELVEPVVDAALSRLADRVSFDLVGEYSFHIPINVVSELFAIPDNAVSDFKRWSDALFAAFNPIADESEVNERIAAHVSLLRLFRRLAHERKHRLGDDLISDIVALQTQGASISDDEIAHNILLLAVAGHQTTTELISNAVHLLLRHPDQLHLLLREPALWPFAIEEVLRYDPPLTQLDRIATTHGEVLGCPFSPGDIIATSILAANHDPDAYVDPHRFDIRRKPSHHISLGRGPHACLGATLARAEAQAAVSKIFEHFPSLRLSYPDEPPKWRLTAGFHGLAELHVMT